MASTSSKSLEALAEKVGRSLVSLVHCVSVQHLSPSADWHSVTPFLVFGRELAPPSGYMWCKLLCDFLH